MRGFEDFLVHLPFSEYVLLGILTLLVYLLLKPFDWDQLRAWISAVFFLLLLTIQFITGISYVVLLQHYLVVEFIDAWIALALSIFYFFLQYRQPLPLSLWRNSILIGFFTFLFLVFVKQVVN